MNEELLKEYRKARKVHTGVGLTGQWYIGQNAAYGCLNTARAELALRRAERERDDFRFAWEYDHDTPVGETGDPASDEWETKALEDGRMEVLGCILYVEEERAPHACPSCKCDPVVQEVHKNSLWGIQVLVDDPHEYKRDVERDLALDTGIIDVPMLGMWSIGPNKSDRVISTQRPEEVYV